MLLPQLVLLALPPPLDAAVHAVVRQPELRVAHARHPRAGGLGFPSRPCFGGGDDGGRKEALLVLWLEARHHLARHAHPSVPPLDQLKVRLVARPGARDEADGDARGAGAAGAADTVRVVGCRARQLIVDNRLEPHDVEAARGDVGRDDDAQRRRAELLEPLLAQLLREAAVQRRRGDARRGQLLRDVLGGLLRRDEDEGAAPPLSGEEVAQQRRPLPHVDRDGALLDGLRRRRRRVALRRRGDGGGGDCVVVGATTVHGIPAQRRGGGGGGGGGGEADGVAQQPLGPRARGVREGGREEERLPARRQLLDDGRQLVGKSGRDQAVGFVEEQHRTLGEADAVAREQLEQPAGRRHEHRRAAAQRAQLRVDRDAAVHRRDARRDAAAARIGVQRAADRDERLRRLRRQLARRRQHQRLHVVAAPPRRALR